jgi:hypothetical protein
MSGVLRGDETGVVVVTGSRLSEECQQGESHAGTDDHQPNEAEERRSALYHKHSFVIDGADCGVKSCANFR